MIAINHLGVLSELKKSKSAAQDLKSNLLEAETKRDRLSEDNKLLKVNTGPGYICMKVDSKFLSCYFLGRGLQLETKGQGSPGRGSKRI